MRIFRRGLPRYSVVLSISAIILLPFLVISLYNQPLGDDFWISALVRQHGFIQAQSICYQLVSSRYAALSVMSINPLVYGNFWLFSFVAIVFCVILCLAFYFFLQSLLTRDRRHLARHASASLSILFVAVYFAVIPGIGEGIYWTSSLVCYQGGILISIIWVALLLRWYLHSERGLLNLILACVCVLGLMGTNEIIAAITGMTSLALLITSRQRKTRADGMAICCTLLSILALCYVAPGHGLQQRLVPQNQAGLLMSLKMACLGTGYYALKCLVNPFFWIGILLFAGPARDFASSLLPGIKLSRRQAINILLCWVLLLVSIEFCPLYFAGMPRPPLRVSNMVTFFFLSGLLTAGLLYLRSGSRKEAGVYTLLGGRGYFIAIVALMLIGFATGNNVSVAAREMISGEAAAYNEELNSRYSIIRNCKTNDCNIPALKNRPIILRYSENDNDRHIGEYFGKQIRYVIP